MQPIGTVVSFYALCDSNAGAGVFPLYRPGVAPPSLEESLASLVAGTTPEEQALGLSTGFDFVDEADEVEVEVDVDGDGVARVDFRFEGERWHPGGRAGTSHQLFSFLDPLYATVFGDPEVVALDRSTLCWGESDCRGVTSRAEWEGTLFVNTGILTHGGCTPELARWYADECTFDGVLVEPTQAATVVNVTADDMLNVRSGPGVEFFQIGELAPGAIVEATAVLAVAADGGPWRLTGVGWVNAAFLDGPDACDPAPIASMAREALMAARLVESEQAWEVSADGGVFGPRTTDPEVFADTHGFDCSWQATHRFGDSERLVVAAWTGRRAAVVIQATDSPTDAYEQSGGPDMEIAAVASEKVADDTWAMTLPDGETLILVARRHGTLGWVAKTWLVPTVPAPGEESAGETSTERMALPVLRGAGGRDVSVAEPSHGGRVAVISLVSPAGDDLFVTVRPDEQFDPITSLPPGTLFHTTFGETLVYLVDPTNQGAASWAAFQCSGFGWAISARDGTVVETSEFIAGLLAELDCA